MAPLDLFDPIAHRIEKIRVGCEDRAIKGKLDDGLGAMKGVELTIMVDSSQDLIRDVRGELDYACYATGPVQDRIVCGLDPDRAPILSDAPELSVCGSPRRRASQKAW